MEDLLWPEDFDPLEVEQCDDRLCDLPVAHEANAAVGFGPKLCEGHFQKWCREYDQREEEDSPERLSFKVYFAEAVPLAIAEAKAALGAKLHLTSLEHPRRALTQCGLVSSVHNGVAHTPHRDSVTCEDCLKSSSE